MSRPLNEDRQAALKYGLRTYTGALHSKCGTVERYAGTGGCVYCARRIATEQREALKYRKAQEASEVVLDEFESVSEFENVIEDAPLDNPLPTELSPDDDDADERQRQSIDELM
jgi:hypothetical protein